MKTAKWDYQSRAIGALPGRPRPYVPKGRPVADQDRWWAHALTHSIGITEAAKVIGVSRYTLASICAGLPVYPATSATVRSARLRNRDDERRQ